MKNLKINLQKNQPVNILDSEITHISYNKNTNVLAIASSDSRIILKNAGLLNKTSMVLLSINSISKIEWIGHYEFIVAGSDNHLYHYSIMDLKNEKFKIYNENIITMKKRENLILTGSAGGNLGIWDYRTKEVILTIPHLYRNKIQPIKDVEANENFLYSTTIYQGRIWLWDIRNTSKKLGLLETKNHQTNLKIIENNLYSASDFGILKISPSLLNHEFLFKKINSQENAKYCISYNERYNNLFWTDKNTLYYTDLGFDEPVCKSIPVDGICGISEYKSDEFIVYTKNGDISTFNISYKV